MRIIGSTEQKDLAKSFGAYLTQQKLGHEIRDDGQTHSIWLYDDAALTDVKADFADFLADPNHKKFKTIDQGLRIPKLRVKATSANKIRRRAWLDSYFMAKIRGNYPLYLIILCGLVFITQNLPGISGLTSYLYFSQDQFGIVPFQEIRQGQIWRLWTPILLHGSIMHFAFNMIWIFQLGRMMEQIEGSFYFVFFVLFTALFSNVAEYLWTGPMFIGISGVVYGLLGYTFAMAQYSRRPYILDHFTMAFMIGWMVLGFLGIIGNIANVTHLAGLMTGSFLGVWRARRSR